MANAVDQVTAGSAIFVTVERGVEEVMEISGLRSIYISSAAWEGATAIQPSDVMDALADLDAIQTMALALRTAIYAHHKKVIALARAAGVEPSGGWGILQPASGGR